MRVGKAVLAVIGATVLLGALVGSASARNMSTSNQALRASFREARFIGAFGNITCQVTIEGSFHSRTAAKVVNSLVGYVTSAAMGGCQEGRATLLRETLPWHIRYSGFTGTLPAITSLRATVTGVSTRIQEPFAGCLFRTTAESPMTVSLNRETVTGAIETAETGGTIPTSCGINGTISSNRGPVTVLNSSTRITITLI